MGDYNEAASATLTTAYAIFRRESSDPEGTATAIATITPTVDVGGTVTPVDGGSTPTPEGGETTATAEFFATGTATIQGTDAAGDATGTATAQGTGIPGGEGSTIDNGTPGLGDGDLSGGLTGDGGGLTSGERGIISSVRGFYTMSWAWIRLGIALPTDLFTAWNTAPVAEVEVLPDCLAAPEDSNICAVYYILDNTLFDGTLGGLIIPAIVIYIDAAILITILGYIRVIIAWVRNLLDS